MKVKKELEKMWNSLDKSNKKEIDKFIQRGINLIAFDYVVTYGIPKEMFDLLFHKSLPTNLHKLAYLRSYMKEK
jgi:hypothetical protein